MYKNYFYLNRLTIELRELLKNASLSEAFSQEKNILVLEFNKYSDRFYLLINTTQNDPYIQYRKDFHRAKKNVTDIFRGSLPQSVINASIAENDRIIKIILERDELIFFIRGKDTNVVLTSQNALTSTFRKMNDNLSSKISTDLAETRFVNGYYYPDLSTNTDNDFILNAKRMVPSLNKEIINETLSKMENNTKEEFSERLNQVINSIYFGDIAVFFDDNLQKMIFAPADFGIFSGTEKKVFYNYFDAINYFLISRFRADRAVNYKKLIGKHLDQQLSKISMRLNEIKIKLEEPLREEEYRNTGYLLLANINSIPGGIKETEIIDFSNEKVTIKLDEKLDAKGNADAYFDKAKNEKRNRSALAELFEKLEKQYFSLTEHKRKFDAVNNNEDYIRIMADLKINDDKDGGQQQDDSSAYRHFLVEKKYHVYVGRDSRNNDQLTTRFAKQNDYWFHARSVSGSHVVLRVDNTKEVIPKSVLKKTASIAAFYSKAKTSKLAPVVYTLKKYVVKRKGMEPGTVSLLKENVLLVEPGIPGDCEYLNE